MHLPGRLRVRAELQLILQNRLRMVDLWQREPAVLEQPVTGPIVVTGLARSGTTFLHELLACDPDNRPPLLWELLHSVPYDEASGDVCDDEVGLMDEMVPAFTGMHVTGGRMTTECIFAYAHQFSSDMFTGMYNVAAYTVWRSGVDQTPIYDWQARVRQRRARRRPSPVREGLDEWLCAVRLERPSVSNGDARGHAGAPHGAETREGQALL